MQIHSWTIAIMRVDGALRIGMTNDVESEIISLSPLTDEEGAVDRLVEISSFILERFGVVEEIEAV